MKHALPQEPLDAETLHASERYEYPFRHLAKLTGASPGDIDNIPSTRPHYPISKKESRIGWESLSSSERILLELERAIQRAEHMTRLLIQAIDPPEKFMLPPVPILAGQLDSLNRSLISIHAKAIKGGLHEFEGGAT